MANQQFPSEVLLVFMPVKGASARQIPKAYTHFIAESEEQLNQLIELKKNQIRQHAAETEDRWYAKYGPDWKSAYRESIGHDFDAGIQAQLQLQPMTFEQFNRFIEETLLSPDANPLKAISSENFYDAYEALPPHNVSRSNFHLSFTMSERLVSSITSQYVKYESEGVEYCASRLVDLSDVSTFITHDEMFEFIDQVKNARELQESSDPLETANDASSNDLSQ